MHGFRYSIIVRGLWPHGSSGAADQGADVIKIEPPGWGDGIRGLGASRNGLSAIYAMLIATSALSPLTWGICWTRFALRLVKDADVLLQNYDLAKWRASVGL